MIGSTLAEDKIDSRIVELLLTFSDVLE